MKIVAIIPVRNEEWVLGLSLRVALEWCDAVVVGLHSCTDRSSDIVHEVGRQHEAGRVVSTNIDGTGWREMEHRQRLLDLARNAGATHIALIDADEIIRADSIAAAKSYAERLMPGECLHVAMHCMWRSMAVYRTDMKSVWSNRRDLALVFRDSPGLRFYDASVSYQHHARAPKGSVPVFSEIPQRIPRIGVLHLQFADWIRLKAKHALYKIRERIDYPDKPVHQIETMYNLAMDEAGIDHAPMPVEWTMQYDSWISKHFHPGRGIWQEAEARRLYAEHGPDRFAGLDLFGVVE